MCLQRYSLVLLPWWYKVAFYLSVRPTDLFKLLHCNFHNDQWSKEWSNEWKSVFWHSHNKWKDSTQAVLLIFSLELEIYVVAVQRIHQYSGKWWLLWKIAEWKWLWSCFSHFMLLGLWCQCLWDSSEDRCRTKRLPQMLLVRYSLRSNKNVSINNSKNRLVTYLLGQLLRS